MPEGDTIFRTATTLRRWLRGREVTGAEARVSGVPMRRVVGSTVEEVEARGKHLLIRFSTGDILHTHMRMTGSWHVYQEGDRWKRPGWQARLVLEAGDRVAVCFNAPIIELLAAHEEHAHPSLAALGPDVLARPLDMAEVRRRAAARPRDTTIGELLLDQQVVAGIGNVYRAEVLFACGLHPWTPLSHVSDDELDAAVTVASTMLDRNARPGVSIDRDTGGGPGNAWVYGRAGRPCRRCRTRIESARLGEQARTVFWCPRCQPSRVDQPVASGP